MTDDAKKSVRRQGRRKLAISLNTGVALLLGALLLVMANYLSYRHYARWDWSRSKYFSLSDKTRGILSGLTNRINVVVFFAQDNDEYQDVRHLLREYEYASPHIRVEFVDPHRDLARTEQLATQYDVTLLDSDVVVFDNAGRTKYVKDSDVSERDISFEAIDRGPEKVAFKGEQAFSSAIQSITLDGQPVVYVLSGHGERSTESFERFQGYSDLAKAITRDHIEVNTLSLGELREMPEDADAVVIAGPTKKLFQPEIDLLDRYLQRNGRMIVLLDAATTTGLEALLEGWGVRVADDVVVDITQTLTGRELFIRDYGTHAITKGLRGTATVMYFPRSVTAMTTVENEGKPADQPRVTALAQSSAAGWAESDLDQDPMAFDAQFDQAGPVSVAVAVERGPGPGIDVQIQPTRLVVFGDSDFLANGVAAGANTDLFMSALNWLLEREELMAIAPKPVEGLSLVMTQRQLRLLFWVVVVAIPAAVGVLGSLVWIRRRA